MSFLYIKQPIKHEIYGLNSISNKSICHLPIINEDWWAKRTYHISEDELNKLVTSVRWAKWTHHIGIRSEVSVSPLMRLGLHHWQRSDIEYYSKDLYVTNFWVSKLNLNFGILFLCFLSADLMIRFEKTIKINTNINNNTYNSWNLVYYNQSSFSENMIAKTNYHWAPPS